MDIVFIDYDYNNLVKLYCINKMLSKNNILEKCVFC